MPFEHAGTYITVDLDMCLHQHDIIAFQEFCIFIVLHYHCCVFQIHRAFLLSSLFVGAIGFMLAFVAHARNPTPGLINLGSSNVSDIRLCNSNVL